jgi:hypothetical protein
MMRGSGLDSAGSGWGLIVGCCEHGNELGSSVKGEEFSDDLNSTVRSKEGVGLFHGASAVRAVLATSVSQQTCLARHCDTIARRD